MVRRLKVNKQYLKKRMLEEAWATWMKLEGEKCMRDIIDNPAYVRKYNDKANADDFAAVLERLEMMRIIYESEFK